MNPLTSETMRFACMHYDYMNSMIDLSILHDFGDFGGKSYASILESIGLTIAVAFERKSC